MRVGLGIVRAAAAAAGIAALAATGASGATVTVTITGAGETGYELDVSGIQKSGRLAAEAGVSTVRDLIEVGVRESVKAVLTFTGRGGVIATCPAVEVKLERAGAACEPAFVLTDRQTGTNAFTCEAKCQPSRRSQKSQDEDDDDDDWVYALAAPARPAAPRLDGWALMASRNNSSQSFYNRAMSPEEGPGVYSPATSEAQTTR